MNKTLWLLIPAALLLSGYLYLRHNLRSSIKAEEKRTGQATVIPDTLRGKRLSAADLRPLFIKRVQQLVKKSSNGLYNLSVSDLKADITASTLSLQGVRLVPDAAVADSLQRVQQLPADVFTIALDSLHIDGINLDDVITSNTMDYRLIKLIQPVITIHHQKRQKKKDATQQGDFSQCFLHEMQKLWVKNVVVEDGTITVYNDAKKAPPTVLKHVAVRLQHIKVDSTTRGDKERFFFARSGKVSFRNFSRPTPDGLYTLKIDAATITAPQNEVRLSGLSFTSPFNRSQFSKRLTYRKEWYNLQLPAVTLTRVNWWALLNEEEVVAEELKTAGGRVDIYLDRSLPSHHRAGVFQNQLLMKLPIQLQIARASTQGTSFSYAEFNPVSKQTGTVYLDDINLQIAHLSNEYLPQSPPVVGTGTTRFMHTVPVQAQFHFDRAPSKTGHFTTSIQIKGFDGALLNSFARPLGLVKVERGTVQSAEVQLQGNEQKAAGTVLIRYSDLKMALLEKDNAAKALDKKDFTSLLANLVVLKKDNPKEGASPRMETADFEHIPGGGFFYLVWKTILVGALKTIGAPAKVVSKTIGSDQQK